MENELNQIGKEFVQRVQAKFASQGINDTGAASDSISYKVEGQKIIIEGLARTLFVNFGRKPGTPPPFNVIKEWVIRKLNVEEDAVWIVTKTIVDKIAAEGTNIFTDPAQGLELEIILQDLSDELFNDIAEQQEILIRGGLIELWQS